MDSYKSIPSGTTPEGLCFHESVTPGRGGEAEIHQFVSADASHVSNGTVKTVATPTTRVGLVGGPHPLAVGAAVRSCDVLARTHANCPPRGRTVADPFNGDRHTRLQLLSSSTTVKPSGATTHAPRRAAPFTQSVQVCGLEALAPVWEQLAAGVGATEVWLHPLALPASPCAATMYSSLCSSRRSPHWRLTAALPPRCMRSSAFLEGSSHPHRRPTFLRLLLRRPRSFRWRTH